MTENSYAAITPAPMHEKLVGALRKTGAFAFLLAVALTPLAIVMLQPHHGSIWVAGYLAGIATVPVIAVVALRAILELAGSHDVNVFVGFVVYGALVVAISAGAALWAFLV